MNKCHDCGSDTEIMIDLTVLIPGEMEGNLTKTNLRKKGVILYAANWEKAAHFCSKYSWRILPPNNTLKNNEQSISNHLICVYYILKNKIINFIY